MMTADEMRRAAGLGPGWDVIWTGADPQDAVPHLCAGLYGRGETFEKAGVDLRYEPTPTPGVEVAKCEWCGIAWVRAGAAPGASH